MKARPGRCQTVADVQGFLYSEFVRWFDADIAGPPERYRRAAERIFAEMTAWRCRDSVRPGARGPTERAKRARSARDASEIPSFVGSNAGLGAAQLHQALIAVC